MFLSRVSCVAFPASQLPAYRRLVLCGCEDGTARCWDLEAATALHSAKKKRCELTAIAVLPWWVVP